MNQTIESRKALRRRMLLAAIVLIFYTLLCFSLAWQYVYPLRLGTAKPAEFDAAAIQMGRPELDLEVARESGQIPVWTLGPEDTPRGICLLVHGYGGSPEDWIPLAQELADRGYRCVVPTMPAHGESPERAMGFGHRESQVVIAAAEWAKHRHPGLPLVAHGLSLGGAAVWLASEQRPEVFDAVGSDGAFADLYSASRAFLSSRMPGADLVLYPVIPMASWLSGVNPHSVRPVDAARKWRGQPALVIHGDADRMFPVRFGKELADASGTELWLIRGGRHAGSMDVGIVAYADRLDALFEPR